VPAKPKHREERPGDIKNSLADISLARKFLGYEPEVKLKEGLAITFDWFSKNFK
jgi:UDP-N-acetylglucosamine 4-epimerase